MFWADLIIGLDSLGKYGLCPILKNQFLLDGPAEKNIRTEFPEQHPGAYSSFWVRWSAAYRTWKSVSLNP